MAIESMTYRELAARLGVSLAAAKMRVARNGWVKMNGNDGRTRVQVPIAELEAAAPPRDIASKTTKPAPAPEADQGHIADLRREIDALQANLATAEAERARLLDDARQDRDRTHGERERLLATIETLTKSLEAATAAQAEAERRETAGRAEGQAEAASVKRELDALRRRGLWARIMNRDG